MLPPQNEGHMAAIRTTEQIGKRLKDLREKAGISQERMAELMAVSKGQLQKYEYGKNMMNTEKLQRAADALSVPIQEFFLQGEDALPVTVEEKLLLDSYRAISDKHVQESILTIATSATKHVD